MSVRSKRHWFYWFPDRIICEIIQWTRALHPHGARAFSEAYVADVGSLYNFYKT